MKYIDGVLGLDQNYFRKLSGVRLFKLPEKYKANFDVSSEGLASRSQHLLKEVP